MYSTHTTERPTDRPRITTTKPPKKKKNFLPFFPFCLNNAPVQQPALGKLKSFFLSDVRANKTKITGRSVDGWNVQGARAFLILQLY
jgi:hypothetical protein